MYDRHRYVDAVFVLDKQVVTRTDKFKYLGVHFNCRNRIDININPVKTFLYCL